MASDHPSHSVDAVSPTVYNIVHQVLFLSFALTEQPIKLLISLDIVHALWDHSFYIIMWWKQSTIHVRSTHMYIIT